MNFTLSYSPTDYTKWIDELLHKRANPSTVILAFACRFWLQWLTGFLNICLLKKAAQGNYFLKHCLFQGSYNVKFVFVTFGSCSAIVYHRISCFLLHKREEVQNSSFLKPYTHFGVSGNRDFSTHLKIVQTSASAKTTVFTWLQCNLAAILQVLMHEKGAPSLRDGAYVVPASLTLWGKQSDILVVKVVYKINHPGTMQVESLMD